MIADDKLFIVLLAAVALGLSIRWENRDHLQRAVQTAIEAPVLFGLGSLVLSLLGLTTFSVWGFTGLSIAAGVVSAVRWVPDVPERVNQFGSLTRIRETAKWFAPVIAGASMGIFMMMFWPEAALLDSIFGNLLAQTQAAVQSIQATVAISNVPLPSTIAPVVVAFTGIFINNLVFAGKTALIGAVGGVTGVASVLMIPFMTGAALFGLFAGVLARNAIIVGDPVLGPPLALLSALGLHTVIEYAAALALAGTAGAAIGRAVLRADTPDLRASLRTAGLALGLLALAGFLEVTASGLLVELIQGTSTIQLNPVVTDIGWNPVAILSATTSAALVLWGVARGTEVWMQ